MAIIKNGVNGTVSGKAGSVVFVLTKTGNYVRSLPRVKKQAPTPEQQLSRTRFKIVRSHISLLNSIIKIGYKAYSYPKRAYDVAMSYNLNEALIQGAPIPSLPTRWISIKKNKCFRLLGNMMPIWRRSLTQGLTIPS